MFLNPILNRRSVKKCVAVEALEGRTLLSESASAQLSLVSTVNTPQGSVYQYDIDVVNTGSSSIGTFWFSWVPGENFLPSVPRSVSNPTGWGDTITGAGDSTDGSAIQWEATSHPISPESSLDGFVFTSTDSPTVLAGQSPTHPGESVLTSFIYTTLPFANGDNGLQISVLPAVIEASSVTTLVSSAATVSNGTAVTFTATVASANGTGAVPQGDVTFLDGETALGTAQTQADGTAAFTTTTLAVGSHTITAQYGGDSTYSASTSTALTEVISSPAGLAATTTTISTSTTTAVAGTAVSLTAAVVPTVEGATPTGTVVFTQGSQTLGTSAVASDGTAVLSTSSLAVGADSIVATYSGDGSYAGSASSAVVVTITAAQPVTIAPVILKSTLPGGIVSSLASKGTVTVSLTNQTGLVQKGKATVAIYASVDGSIDGSAVLLGQISKGLNLKASKSVNAAVGLKLAAGKLVAGSYTLMARVTDVAGNVNDSAAGSALVVAAPVISLSEALVKDGIPSTVTAGKKSSPAVMLSITNGGNITTPLKTTVTLSAVVSGQAEGNSIVIGSLTKALRIAAGKTVRVSVPSKLISTVPVGSYVVVAQVTDPKGQVTSMPVGDFSVVG